MSKTKPVPAPTPSAHRWLPWVLPAISVLSISTLNDPATLPRTLVWVLAMLLWMGMMWAAHRRRAEKTQALPLPLLVAVALVILSQLLSMIAAISTMESLLSALRMALLLLTTWLVWEHQRRGGIKSAHAWMMGLWITGLVQASVVVGQQFADFTTAPMGTQQNSNLVGSLMALSIPAALGLAAHSKGKLRWGVLASLPILLVAIYLSESRAALLMLLVIALLGAGVVLAHLREWVARPQMRWAVLGIAALAVVATAIALYVGWGRKEMPRSYANLSDDTAVIEPGTTSVEVRMILWNKSLQMAMDHPLTGVGAGNWKLHIPSYGVAGYDAQGRYGSIFYVRPHNDWLWTFAETGFLGLIGYLGFFGMLLGYAVHRRGGETWMLRAVGLLGITAYLVDAFFSFPIERIENTVMLAAYAGFALTGVQARAGRTLPSLGMGVAVLLPTLVLALLRLPSDAATLKMRQAQTKKNYSVMQREAEKADTPWCRYEAQTATPFGWHLAMSKVEQARPLGAAMATSPLVREALDDLLLAQEIAPHNYLVLSELGSTYSTLGQFPQAERAFRELVTTFPTNQQGWVNLAVCHYNLQQYAAIREDLSHVSNDFPDPNLAPLRKAIETLP